MKSLHLIHAGLLCVLFALPLFLPALRPWPLYLLAPLAADASPFVDPVPREDAVGARWVRPELVVEVASLGFTPQHRLRQPAYLGLRTDVGVDELGVEGA